MGLENRRNSISRVKSSKQDGWKKLQEPTIGGGGYSVLKSIYAVCPTIGTKFADR